MRMTAMVFLVFLYMPRLAFANGMPIDKAGQFYGSPATVITLTEAQMKELDNPEKKRHRIALTEDQRAKLMKESGRAPRMFMFYDTRIGETDCTCEAANRALRFSESEAEIPHEYLMSEEDAAEIDKNY